jgi:hypothetical protein
MRAHIISRSKWCWPFVIDVGNKLLWFLNIIEFFLFLEKETEALPERSTTAQELFYHRVFA